MVAVVEMMRRLKIDTLNLDAHADLYFYRVFYSNHCLKQRNVISVSFPVVSSVSKSIHPFIDLARLESYRLSGSYVFLMCIEIYRLIYHFFAWF
jgi:hypothetical protein